MQWIFCPINDIRVIRDNYDCGIPELNDYLKKYARQNQRKGIAKTWVAILKDGDGQVAGYYSISMAELKQESLPENYRKGLPRYPIPVMRIGKLAVDRSIRNCRIVGWVDPWQPNLRKFSLSPNRSSVWYTL